MTHATTNAEMTLVAELDAEHASELPGRDLLSTVSVLGLPLAGVDGVNVNVDTSGPNWLFGSVGNVQSHGRERGGRSCRPG